MSLSKHATVHTVEITQQHPEENKGVSNQKIYFGIIKRKNAKSPPVLHFLGCARMELREMAWDLDWSMS